MALSECVPTGNVHCAVSRIWALKEGLTHSYFHCWVNRKDPIIGRCSKVEMGAEKCMYIGKNIPMFVAAVKPGANVAFVLLVG